MSLYAYVTLLTTDAYLPGALVAIQSVLEAEGSNPAQKFETVCLVTPATVSVESIKALRKSFSLVVGVEELRSGSESNLALLGRQDLASTLTKLQLFRLIQFRKIIFLDADTLCLQPLSHLFSLDAPFAACPDSGWPDCFNSGMFVCTPSAATFDGLVTMASERGSWDGGDQGLLNDFFPDWHRLSFTYNVTPSAYYTYAPAYRRHGASIKLVHFIGTDKPWNQASSRRSQIPTRTPSSTSPEGKHDYESLLDRWFGVYQHYFGSRAASQTFTFPTLQAVWDAPHGSHSRASYTPPSLEELKKQFQGVHAAQPGGARSSLPVTTRSSIEGHYVSMPLRPGRPDLTGAMVFIPRIHVSSPELKQDTQAPPTVDPAKAPSPPIAPPHLVAPVPVKPARHPVEQHRQPSPAQASRPWSPAQVAWDPARSEPPKGDRPQMEAGFNYQAENVWDEPRSSASQKTFFKAPSQYGSIPSVTHQNYTEVARYSPDMSKLKPIFPWETSASASKPYMPTRVFPVEQTRKPKLTPTRPAPPPPTSPGTPKFSAPHARHHYRQDNEQHGGPPTSSSSSAPPPPTFTDFANLSSAYTNAWDNVAGIRRYAKNLEGPKKNGQPAPPAHQQRQPSYHGGHHQQSSSQGAVPFPSSSHSRSASMQAAAATRSTGVPDHRDRDRQRSQSSSSGYDTGGEASSRDGDDEDDEEEEDRRRAARNARAQGSGYSQASSTTTASSGSSVPAYMPSTLRPGAAADRFSGSRSSSSETVTPHSPSVAHSYPGPAPALGAVLPDPSTGAYKPTRVSRVFDPSTATDVVRKEGLEALHRFVRSMEAKGAAANGNAANGNHVGNSNGNGNMR